MPGTDFVMLQRYYAEEPWGTWRDNMHAAIISREVAKTVRKRGTRVPLEDFLLIDPEKRGRGNVLQFKEMLKAMAGGKPVKMPTKKPPSGKRKVAKAHPRKRNPR